MSSVSGFNKSVKNGPKDCVSRAKNFLCVFFCNNLPFFITTSTMTSAGSYPQSNGVLSDIHSSHPEKMELATLQFCMKS